MVEPACQAWVPLCSCHHLELARTEVAAAQWQICHLDTDSQGKIRLLCYMTTTACVHDEKYCSRKVALLGGRCRSTDGAEVSPAHASFSLAGTIMLEGINAACLRSVFPFTASMLLRV